MPRKLNHSVAWLLGISFILLGIPSFAEPSAIEEVLGVLGMDKGQIAQLAQGQPVVYALSEGRTDEFAIGVVCGICQFLWPKWPDICDWSILTR